MGIQDTDLSHCMFALRKGHTCVNNKKTHTSLVMIHYISCKQQQHKFEQICTLTCETQAKLTCPRGIALKHGGSSDKTDNLWTPAKMHVPGCDLGDKLIMLKLIFSFI